MHFFNIEAVPHPGSVQADTEGGAMVACWIDFKLQDGAELLARHYIEQAGWSAGETEYAAWVGGEDYADDPENRKYFLEAQQDGATLVFFTYPTGGEQEEEPPVEA
jgi:hypothetical protein